MWSLFVLQDDLETPLYIVCIADDDNPPIRAVLSWIGQQFSLSPSNIVAYHRGRIIGVPSFANIEEATKGFENWVPSPTSPPSPPSVFGEGQGDLESLSIRRENESPESPNGIS